MIKEKLDKVEKLVNSELSSKISGSEIVFEELLFKTSTNEIIDVIKFLKLDERLKFKQLIDIAAIDYPNEEKRFEMVYLLLSIENNIRLKISIKFESNDKSVYEGKNQLYIDLYETENKIVNIARNTFGISDMKRIHLLELRKRKDKLLSRFKVFSHDDDFIRDFCNSILAHIEESFSIILNVQ